MAEEKNAFTKSADNDGVLPDEAPSVQRAKALRELQLSGKAPSAEEVLAVGLPDPESHNVPESQASEPIASRLVYTNDVSTLPKGASGRIIADGVVELTARPSESKPAPEAAPVFNKFAPPPHEEERF